MALNFNGFKRISRNRTELLPVQAHRQPGKVDIIARDEVEKQHFNAEVCVTYQQHDKT